MLFPINEIFYSLQGEGRNTGVPSIFIRFRGCNLRCGYCDTPYAVLDHKDCINMTLDEVVDKIKSFPCNHIIFTGGEPALFEKQINLIQDTLEKCRYTFEIETNGAIDLQNHYDQVNVSYKTSNSGNKKYELKALSTGYDYKFVVANEEDLREVKGIIEEYNLQSDHIYLMPLGTTKESQINLVVAQYCLDKGYRYCQRTHIMLFGNRRGV